MGIRKRFAPVALFAAASMVLAACGDSGTESEGAGTDLSGQQLVVVNYGGTSGDAMQKAWIDPFVAETGAQVVSDSPSDLAKVKTMVDSGNVTWDVIDFGGATGLANCGTLFEKRPADFDMSAFDPKYVTDDCGVPIFSAPVQVVYNKKLYADNPPTSVEDFMDVENFPGKRIFLNWPEGLVEPFLMTTGITPEELYPIDWTKVEAAAKQLGDSMTPQDTIPAATQSLESGDFGFCLCFGGNMTKAAENGAEFGVLWDKTHVAWDMYYAVKGSKYPEAQWAFLEYISKPEVSARFYEISPYISPMKDPIGETPEEFRQFLYTYQNPDSEIYLYDPEFWMTNMDESIAEWTRIMSGG